MHAPLRAHPHARACVGVGLCAAAATLIKSVNEDTLLGNQN